MRSWSLALTVIAFAFLQATNANALNQGGKGTDQLTGSAFTVSLHKEGQYSVSVNGTDWKLEGSLPSGFTALDPSSGDDHVGHYHQLSAQNSRGRVVQMRLYDGRPLLLFQEVWGHGGGNDLAFPSFLTLPLAASRYSFKHEAFAHYAFNALGEDGPWVLFQGSHAIVLSPADHYRVSTLTAAADGSASSGIRAEIKSFPDGFSHGTLLAAGDGVNAAMQAWGSGLQALGGKNPMANENASESDPVLNKLGYWTDNGANYYYKFDPKLGYAGTLLSIKDSFEKLGVPLGYMQLDSWFYPKGQPPAWDNGGGDLPFGEDTYRADAKLFPHDLSAFQQQLGLPLVTHARWVAPGSPYRRQFAMSGNVVIDPAFWEQTAAYLKQSGVVTYEQDWLDHNASTELNLGDPSAFLGNMASAMKRQKLSMQYCMGLPSDYMASSQYPNLATIRTSGDRFERSEWDAFLYDSRMATVVGALPWTDVFMSSEPGNLLIATLSGGPVGVGDAIGATSASNLLHALNGEGEIVKPDAGLHPIDRVYAEDAAGKQSPMVAVATSGASHVADASYVLAYPRRPDEVNATVSLAELGISGQAVAYDWTRQTISIIPPAGSVNIEFVNSGHDNLVSKEEAGQAYKWGYVVVVPCEKDGIALLGDPAKFVMLSNNNVSRVVRGDIGTVAVIDFGRDKQPKSFIGYSTHRPVVKSSNATAFVSGFNKSTGLFRITVARGEEEQASVSIQ